jgi:hypothetical protein
MTISSCSCSKETISLPSRSDRPSANEYAAKEVRFVGKETVKQEKIAAAAEDLHMAAWRSCTCSGNDVGEIVTVNVASCHSHASSKPRIRKETED